MVIPVALHSPPLHHRSTRMWMFLLACSLDSLVSPEPVQGPIPSLVVVDGVREAVVVTREAPPPAWERVGSAEELLDDRQPPYADDLRALVLADPDHPWLREVLTRPLSGTSDALHTLQQSLMQDDPTCRFALDHADAWGLGVEVFDGCPWSFREAVLTHFPEAAARPAWMPQPLPDDLAQAFASGAWLPNVAVRVYPTEARRIQRAAERCVDDAIEDDLARRCLLAVATLEWSAARERRGRFEGALREALDRFPTGRDVEAWLDEQGFPPRPDDAPVEGGSLPDRLRRRGALWEPYATPARFPLLLSQLGVDDVALRFLPTTPLGRYRTAYAYHDGERLRVLLDPLYGTDPEQLTGFANVLARRAGAERRALWIVDQSLGWLVVAGPPAALRALIDEGLVDLPDPLFREAVPPLPPDGPAPIDTALIPSPP